MPDPLLNPNELVALARLFAYPEPNPETTRQGPAVAGAKVAPAGCRSLENEYVRLFINSLPEVPCPPYGSVYLEGTLMGRSTVRLRKIYRGYGFDTAEMPDHLSVELEFLAVLAALAGHPESREDYAEVLDHLRAWTPEFCSRVERHDRTGHYRQAAGRLARLLFAQDAGDRRP